MRVRTKVGPGARAVDVEHGKTQHYAGPLQPGVKCQQGARLGPQGCCQVEGVESSELRDCISPACRKSTGV